MSSILILCNDQQEIKKTVTDQLHIKIDGNPDLYQINLENESIKIKQIREIGEKLLYSPSKEKYKTFILYNFEKTTLPAQNAFLKSLEEHPVYIQFILQCNSLNGVLDTIQSRCVIKRCQSSSKNTTSPYQNNESILESAWKVISSGSYADIIELCSDYKNRDDALQFADDLIIYLHTTNSRQPNKNIVLALQILPTCIDQLKQNANVILTLEDHLFSIKSRF